MQQNPRIALIAAITTSISKRSIARRSRNMAEWEYICNGGPNGRSVCGTAKSVGAACGCLEKMMKALGATIGQVQRADAVEDHGHPVETEEEAGR
jgi:formylglycine-generating enzyme required for sulfatase activity